MSASAPPRVSDRERDCLQVMFEWNPDPDNGGLIFYAHITDALKIELGQARRAVRALVRKGLAHREACFDDDGMIRGSGVGCTHAGAALMNAHLATQVPPQEGHSDA